MSESQVFIDGTPADVATLARIAQFNVGHFTSMQVHDGAVRGLDLHLERLVRDAREVFDALLDPELVRSRIRQALDGRSHANLRVAVFARNWSTRQIGLPAQLSVMVGVSAPRSDTATPLRLMPVQHERFMPHVKHSATFDLFALRHRARVDGFEDALFIDRNGCISEGTTWNIGFFDGKDVVWPEASQLQGITMQLLQRGLESMGIVCRSRPVTLAQVPDFSMAFACNAGIVVQPVTRIGNVSLATDADFIAGLVRAFESQSSHRP
jgi:branched-subunit amino acid aminotransferase/4-amino-4-deoxychorismate lyase